MGQFSLIFATANQLWHRDLSSPWGTPARWPGPVRLPEKNRTLYPRRETCQGHVVTVRGGQSLGLYFIRILRCLDFVRCYNGKDGVRTDGVPCRGHSIHPEP